MHKYFRAIGLSKPLNQLEQMNFVKDTVDHQTYRVYTTDPEEGEILTANFRMDFGSGYGISVYGEFDEDGEFSCERMEPYLYTGNLSSFEELSVEERIDGSSFAGICDDMKVGCTIIFRLLNAVEYLKYKRMGVVSVMLPTAAAYLTGLSVKGTILMPVAGLEKNPMERRQRSENRRFLMRAANNGDEKAMQTLTMQDISTYNVLFDRIQNRKEDIYSLVDTYFMPYGVECDLYNILGNITNVKLTENPLTNEKVYILSMDCNELLFDLCINQKDLYGVPEVGRRFKGTIWLQGTIGFPESIG